MLEKLLLSAFFAFFLSLILTRITITLAKKLNILDYPGRPHPAILHKIPIPRAGGIPIILAIAASYFIFSPSLDKHVLGILLGGLLVVVIGILDDKYDLNPYLRLLSNFLAGLIVVASGVGITWITNPFDGQIRLDSILYQFNFPDILPYNFFAGPHSIILLADIFAILWIVWIMNAINWSSGVDGQLSGIAAISILVLGAVALKYLQADPTQGSVASLAFVSGGAYLGFLPWSFYPQKIMPGYGGAALAGFLLATLSILAGGKLATAFLVLAVPLVDGFWVILRRLILEKRNPVWGDKKHFHHLLLSFGWQKYQIATLYWLIALLFGSLALIMTSKEKIFAITIIIVIILGTVITLGYILSKRRLNL
ncbi:MAG: hypothetical protein A2Y57_02555 [Candidatus Woykebacteria bacterium RBG_13_40_7b]|uniref:Undecaprenyl-phosphate alpha-N-acetylglucosaminyl 1-phosphate transferase n=1 Tax=Candidatus Woykebacteria bacterium RBG_13_40_7b TaxID=1802594 RepID=A0A1G1WBF5_9BACT|nr:MAG: hypothetical protein A2Y57_02555 [Candidatus Woykebacteria bacterium RBG_13_40_7b]